MGLDHHFLVSVPWDQYAGCFGIWRGRVLAVSVSFPAPCSNFIKLTIPSIKVISICIFFLLAVIISTGGIGPGPIGFKYWNDPGAFADGINGVAKTFVIAGTLYAGTEMYNFSSLSS